MICIVQAGVHYAAVARVLVLADARLLFPKHDVGVG